MQAAVWTGLVVLAWACGRRCFRRPWAMVASRQARARQPLTQSEFRDPAAPGDVVKAGNT